MFREQVGTVSAWFDRWTPCEQTVAMVALLRRLHPTQARFVASVLQKQLSDCGELRRAEILANDSSMCLFSFVCFMLGLSLYGQMIY